jgi:predicted HicB family RNase H-like nuclease
MTKTLKISSELHLYLKIYCAKNGITINEWVEKCLKEGMKLKKLYVEKTDN